MLNTFLIVLAVAVVVMLLAGLPSIKRYLRIRRM